MNAAPGRRRHYKLNALDVVLLIVAIPVLWFTEAYLVMLLFGAIHLEVWDKLPPFGFLQVVLIQLGLFLISAWVKHARS